MCRRLATILFVLAALAAISVLAACGGDDEELEVVEGEPIELGQLRYNVLFTRFLNPDDVEDSGYLVGQQPAPPDELYLGVFVRVENDGDAALNLPEDFTIVDTEGNEYETVFTDSPFALEPGSQIEGEGEVPVPQSTAQSGLTQGSMLLYLVDRDITENRPVELEIPADTGEHGIVELDL